MYGFTGLYGNPYGLTITGRANVPATNTQGQVKSSTAMQSQIGARPGFRVRETDVNGCINEYTRQTNGTWKVTKGPKFVGITVPTADPLWQRLETAARANVRDITPAGRPPGRFCEAQVENLPLTDDETDTGDDGGDDSPPPPDYTRLIVGGLVIASGIAGFAYLLRKKKGGT